jgi:hypothetical protein
LRKAEADRFTDKGVVEQLLHARSRMTRREHVGSIAVIAVFDHLCRIGSSELGARQAGCSRLPKGDRGT